jgi:hypothetical protein
LSKLIGAVELTALGSCSLLSAALSGVAKAAVSWKLLVEQEILMPPGVPTDM